MTIDITKPLELSDGTRVTLRNGNQHWICVNGRFGAYDHCYFELNGRCHVAWKKEANGRTLRNVKETTVNTGLEHVQRMEALLRRMAITKTSEAANIMPAWSTQDYMEARAIVAELDKGNLPDIDAAREVAKQVALKVYPEHWGIYDDIANSTGLDMTRVDFQASCDEMVACSLAAIAKGRELALAEVADKLREAKYFRAFHLLGLQHAK